MKNQDNPKPEKPAKPESPYFEMPKNTNTLTGFPSETVRVSKDSGMTEHRMPSRNRR